MAVKNIQFHVRCKSEEEKNELRRLSRRICAALDIQASEMFIMALSAYENQLKKGEKK